MVFFGAIAGHKTPHTYIANRFFGAFILLASYRGKQGGFCLREGAEKTDLMRILTLIEGPGFHEDCVLGLKLCSDETACPMHTRWSPIKHKIVRLLHEQTLEKLAGAVKSGRYRLVDLPDGLVFVERRYAAP